MTPFLDALNRNISVRLRLLGLVALVSLFFCVGGYDLWQHDRQQTTDGVTANLQRARANALREVQFALADFRYWQLAQLSDAAEGKPEAQAQAKVHVELAVRRLKERTEQAAQAVPAAIAAVNGDLQTLLSGQQRIGGLAANAEGTASKTVAEYRARVDSLYDRVAGMAQTANDAANAASQTQHTLLPNLFSLAGLLTMSGVLVLVLILSIVRPLESLVAGAEGLTHGALDTPLPVARDDEFGAVAKALDQFRNHARRWDYLAYHDPLTGLANRAKLEGRLAVEVARALEEGKALMLMYIGLDQLTTINDTFGPASGDEFLKIAARRLRACVPESTQVFHVSGSHFAVLPAAVPNDARMIATADQLARSLVNDLSRPFSLQEQEIEMAVKLGIVTCPQDGTSYEELIANAHAAVTHARRTVGNNFQFYTRQLTEKARARMALASQLRRAVSANELRLVYQPVLDVATNQIVAAEALIRWQHPTRGLIMPGEFIQAAEESGVISAMGEWCLIHACADARRWRDAGLEPLKLAVNLSARQLGEPGLVDIIQRALEQADLSPSDLELEITESTVMQNPESSVRVLRHLKSLGISLSVDDFGTGYSSLTYLQRFPLDKIKIDRSFVSRLSRRRKDELIIAATTGLATDLGLKVVAEGVETAEQMRMLQQLGCNQMQGFLFSRGLPLEEFLSWARSPGSRMPAASMAIN